MTHSLSVAVHETGHAIGLPHSSDSNDVMFPATRTGTLSDRDRRTAAVLYRLPPGRSGTSPTTAGSGSLHCPGNGRGLGHDRCPSQRQILPTAAQIERTMSVGWRIAWSQSVGVSESCAGWSR